LSFYISQSTVFFKGLFFAYTPPVYIILGHKRTTKQEMQQLETTPS
jgi:hypothetical protein